MTTSLVSSTPSNIPGNSESDAPSVSADGRYVAFSSSSSDLVSGDSNNLSDVFVRDLQTNTTLRVSLSNSGNQSNGLSFSGSISADGRYVAFSSAARNLVAGDTNNLRDVFVRDLQTNTTRLVSLGNSGNQGNGSSVSYYIPSISADGRYVVFRSSASNLVALDTNSALDIFVRDLKTNTTRRVSVSQSILGLGNSNGNSDVPSISANGRYVAFSSSASNLVANDTNGTADVFVRDLQTNTTRLVSLSNSGNQGNGGSGNGGASISANGRYVAFGSSASNLVANDTNGTADVFVRDLKTNITRLVSLSNSGSQGNSSSGGAVSISAADGRYVAFSSEASNLVAGDTNGTTDVFVRDLKTNITHRISLDSFGNQSNGGAFGPSISADGSYAAFESDASNLVPNDTNGFFDVFITDGVTLNAVRSDASAITAADLLIEGDTVQSSVFYTLGANLGSIAFTSFALTTDAGNNLSNLLVDDFGVTNYAGI